MFQSQNEHVTLTRDCDAVVIPAGDKVKLLAGMTGFLTQALGGSFTVYIDGNLFRIAGTDGDAIGKEPLAGPEVPEDASEAEIEAAVWQQLRTCYDPEIPINIVELGLVYECKVERAANGEREVKIKMTLTAPGCGMGEILAADVREKVGLIPTVARADVELVFDPPWNQSMMSEEARLEAGLL
jgi:probable FeS assembly SUF system protein SufT